MPSLKSLRVRIASVKSTRKITSAMKMVAAAKLRRAQEQAQAAQPYAERMAALVGRIAPGLAGSPSAPRLLAGTGGDQTHLLVVVTSDRGLCGGFNGQLFREARKQIERLVAEGKTVKLVCVGRKGRDLLRRSHGDKIVESFEGVGRQRLTFADAARIGQEIIDRFDGGEFDVAWLVFNRFRSVVKQEPTVQQLIPFPIPQDNADPAAGEAIYEFEPDEGEILTELLPRNLAVQAFRALLDSAAGEQAARMTAMDNATRNAGQMIDKLTTTYNRTRQAYITKELIEIISGAEAV